MVDPSIYEMYAASYQRRLTHAELSYIEHVQQKYPYFSLAHFLKAKNSQEEQDVWLASIHSADRPLLKKFLTGKTFLPDTGLGVNMKQTQEKSPIAHQPQTDLFSILDFDQLTTADQAEYGLFSLSENWQAGQINWSLDQRIKEASLRFLPLFDTIHASIRQADNHRPPSDEDLISQFLSGDQRLSRPDPTRSTIPTPEYVGKSVEEDEELISETLAKILLRQNNRDEAILVYQKLSLRFPDKKAYFDAQIQKINNR